MILRRIVTDTHSLDFLFMEDEPVITITDLESEHKLTIEVDRFITLARYVLDVTEQVQKVISAT